MAGLFDFFRRRGGGDRKPAPAMAIRDLAFREIKKIWSAEESDIIEPKRALIGFQRATRFTFVCVVTRTIRPAIGFG